MDTWLSLPPLDLKDEDLPCRLLVVNVGYVEDDRILRRFMPLVAIDRGLDSIRVYRLPEPLFGWARQIQSCTAEGIGVLPAEVEFRRGKNGRLGAFMLRAGSRH